MQALFGGSPSVSIGVTWKDAEARKKTTLPAYGDQPLFIFESGDDVEGEVKISVPGGKKVEHGGVRIELKGVVEFAGEKVVSHDVMTLTQDLAMSGMFSAIQILPFSFNQVVFPYETYLSPNVKVRFFAKVIILKSGGFGSSNIVQTFEFVVHNPQLPPSVEEDSDIKLEVGIEDCLHIEFQYDRTKYHLEDLVTGRIDFLLVRIKLRTMELGLIRRETINLGNAVQTNSDTLMRYEIMDGAPVKGERIPVRMPLSTVPLTPSVGDQQSPLFNVRYFLNLVLVDEEDRRYFKQQEITLWRKKELAEK